MFTVKSLRYVCTFCCQCAGRGVRKVLIAPVVMYAFDNSS